MVFCWFPSVLAGGAATWGHCVLSRFSHWGLGVHVPVPCCAAGWSVVPSSGHSLSAVTLSCNCPFPLIDHRFRKFNETKVCFLEETWTMQKQVALGRREESVRTA